MLITDNLLLNYKRCKRRAFLDIHGDFNSQDQEPDFLLKLRRDSHLHQQAILNQEIYYSPNYPRGDWQAGAKATLSLMQQGKERISQAVLLMHTQDATLLSRIDLLVKQPGQSLFGDWMYVPANIKLGRRPKPEYQIVAAFNAQLLAATQGILPSVAWLILRRQDTYIVNLERWLPLMQDILSECSETLLQQQKPELFISRQRCSLCHWYSSCYAIAKTNQHLSLLPGVTPSRYQDLQTLGISTVQSLATASIDTLETLIISEIAEQLVQQAQSTVQNQAMLRHQPSTYHTDAITSFKKMQSLSSAPVELYFDIEAEPDLQLDYLLGVLIVDHRTNTQTFQAFLAENPSGEASIWQQFLDLVALYPNAPIFHFSDYEVEAVKRLIRLYKTHTPQQAKHLISRFVDLHQQVMQTVTLPVESYSLKHLARWLGFEWREPAINGSKCVCLYDQWLEKGDRSLLELITNYNEDDCRATYHLKHWLSNFLLNSV